MRPSGSRASAAPVASLRAPSQAHNSRGSNSATCSRGSLLEFSPLVFSLQAASCAETLAISASADGRRQRLQYLLDNMLLQERLRRLSQLIERRRQRRIVRLAAVLPNG